MPYNSSFVLINNQQHIFIIVNDDAGLGLDVHEDMDNLKSEMIAGAHAAKANQMRNNRTVTNHGGYESFPTGTNMCDDANVLHMLYAAGVPKNISTFALCV